VSAVGDGQWKLSVDQQGVTIASDRFQLTTAGSPITTGEVTVDDPTFALAETSQIEAIVAELESMTRRSYGQYCGLARAMELVGERWTMLIVRDLSVGPKTIAGLQHGLPRIPGNTLSARMRELEHTGLVRRRPMPNDAVGYELTEYGSELQQILLGFSRWGAKMLGEPRPDEIVTTDSLVNAMRSVFDPDSAQGVRASYEIRVDDERIFHIRVADGTAHVGPGPLPDADLRLEPGFALKSLMDGQLSAEEAIANGTVKIVGDPALLQRFTEMFPIPSPPSAPDA
jgi:DNA-binding HxlR family transcriptional regulator